MYRLEGLGLHTWASGRPKEVKECRNGEGGPVEEGCRMWGAEGGVQEAEFGLSYVKCWDKQAAAPWRMCQIGSEDGTEAGLQLTSWNAVLMG